MGYLLHIGIGVFATVLGLLFMSLSFATDHWIEYVVQRDLLASMNSTAIDSSLATNPLYFNRNRGLIRTCYPDMGEADWIDAAEYESRRVDGICLYETGYELTQNPNTVHYGDSYEIRKHLMRAHVGFQVVAMICIFIAIGLSVMACWKTSDRTLRYTGITSFMCALFMAGAMGFFHGYDYLEREKLAQAEFRKVWENTPPLQDHAGATYGYSYIFGWIGLGVELIATVMFLVAANAIQRDREDELDEKDSYIDDRPMRAYDYMDAGVPVPYPPSYDYPTLGGPSDYPMVGPAIEYAPSGGFGSERMAPMAVPAIEYAPSGLGYGY